MKKAYIIPLVILLLFVSVLPSFAVPVSQDPVQDETEDFLTPDRSIIDHESLCYVYVLSNGSFNCKFNSSTVGLNRFNHLYTRSISSDTSFEVSYGSNSSTVFVNGISVGSVNSQNPTVSAIIQPGDVIYIANRSNPTFGYIHNSVSSLNLSLYWNSVTYDIVDGVLVPLEYLVGSFSELDHINVDSNGTVYSIQGSFTDFSNFINGAGDYTFYIFDGSQLLNFYSHTLFEPFSYIGQLTSSYSDVFILFIAILSILVFIFLVVFIFKRFTGGKC